MEIKEFKQRHMKVLLELSRKHGYSVEQIIKMYRSQFQVVEKQIAEDSVKPIDQRQSIKLRGLGTFKYNPYIAEKITEQKRLKDEREIFFKAAPEDGDGTQSD